MKIDWDELRNDQFPSLKNFTYAMAASASLICKNAYQKAIEYFNDMYNNGDIHFDENLEELNELRKIIADYINTESDNIAFLPNTSSSMNIIAHYLDKAGILYPSIEFPASIHIFRRLGFACKKIIPTNNKYIIEDFEKLLDGNIKYIVHSHVQSLTGFKQNLKELGKFCKENNLINIINATQSFGSFPIDVKNQDIDILACSALKWVCCGYGAGILYIKERLIKDKEIPFSSWLSVEDPYSLNNENLNIINKTRYIDVFGGCPNFAALFSLKGALELIKDKIGGGNIKTGIENIKKRILMLTSEFIKKIEKLNYNIITPLDINYRSGIITLEHNKAEEIYTYLMNHKIYISLKRFPKHSINTLLRLSFNYYNNLDDIDKIISLLKKF